MTAALYVTAHGHLQLESAPEAKLAAAAAERIRRAFEAGTAQGLLHLGTAELATPLPPPFAFAREVARRYLTHLSQGAGFDDDADIAKVEPPATDELAALVLQAPPMKGLEYLDATAVTAWWSALDTHVRARAGESGGARALLAGANPVWRTIGRVTFHLAENKNDAERPFAFLATYVARLSEGGQARHLPLARALKQYAGAGERPRLVTLLSAIQRAAERLPWVQELLDGGGLYQPLGWTPRAAHRFLKDVPALEDSGLIVRVPDWWRAARPPRPRVSVRIGDRPGQGLGADALLDFKVGIALDGEPLDEGEIRGLAGADGLVRLRGRWVEIDGERLSEALAHWRQVERQARAGGISFFEGMRLLTGAGVDDGAAAQEARDSLRAWTGVEAGHWLEDTLARLRTPPPDGGTGPPGLLTPLRPYQQTGVEWLRFVTGLRLGACLADDMGLGKTLQVLALLLHGKEAANAAGAPSLLVVPTSLIANWRAELARFAPSLSYLVAHPAEAELDLHGQELERAVAGQDLVVTTYGMIARLERLRALRWRLVILDEAQAIKNSGTRQARAVKQVEADARIALTGTPVENRLSDLWSLFDFLNPGLLGDATAFRRFTRRMAESDSGGYAPLRALVQPYILRRLKTDRRVIADLPEKTEVRAWCGLSRQQAALYAQAVRELERKLAESDGIKRRGIVLAALMQLKQICNHPAHWQATGDWDPRSSGKFERLSALAGDLAERQEKALVFTQFREIAEPLAEHLAAIFGRPGLVLHGGTAVRRRRDLVEAFQRDEGPPFLVLSLKAGGTGLNLTAACHVIHFDRWWNPAVENQATDRAFRIGQKRNVLVHKFVCRGTVEEKIDRMIEEKVALARDLLDVGPEKLLTEMDDRELLGLVALDIHKARER